MTGKGRARMTKRRGHPCLYHQGAQPGLTTEFCSRVDTVP
jgi:hypothetical protein